MESLIVIRSLCAFFMTGVIWFVQLVHYPLFRVLGPNEFPQYHLEHTRRTTWVVVVPMTLELLSSLALAFLPVARMTPFERWTSLVLVTLIWASTFVLQVPLHERLSVGPDPVLMTKLTNGNWVRTVLWSASSGLMTLVLIRISNSASDI